MFHNQRVVDFAVKLADSILQLSNGKGSFLEKFFKEIQINKALQETKFWGASEKNFWVSTS